MHHFIPLFCYLLHSCIMCMVQFAAQLYYFAPAFKVRIFTAKAATSFMGTCTASSVATTYFTCDKALGSSSDEWISQDDGTSAWIRVQLNGLKNVTKLEIKTRCKYDRHSVKGVKVEFDGGSTQSVIIICYVGWMETLQSSIEIC